MSSMELLAAPNKDDEGKPQPLTFKAAFFYRPLWLWLPQLLFVSVGLVTAVTIGTGLDM
jgi:hypothetical protein